MAHLFQIGVQYLCLAILVALATVYMLVGLKKVGKCLYTRLPPASLVVLALAAVITICEAQKRTGTTGVPPVAGGTTGTTGVPPVANPAANTLHISAIDVSTNGTVTLTAAWPENFLTAGQMLDVLGKENLRDDAWTWLTNGIVVAGATNISWALENQSPSNYFYKVVVRDSFADMDDPDYDGIPNVYELHHGTNPWMPDSSLVPKLTVGTNGEFVDIVSALVASEDYSIIAVTSGVYQVNNDIQMPPHPVMVTCEDGYAVFSGTTSRAMFLLGNGHESGHTLFRNLYLNLTSMSGMQAGFWCGGGLPWVAPGAAAVFENVHIRAPNPGVEYFGWLFYAPCDASAVIKGCCVNASGAEWIYAVFGDNPPPIVVESCTFVNFPTQSVYQSAAIGLRSTQANGAITSSPPVAISHVLFDASFTNAWPLVRFENAGGFPVTMTDCIRPSEPASSDFMANVTNNVHVVTSQVAWAGFPLADSSAAVLGIGAFAPLVNDPFSDMDNDGISDYEEVFLHGADPWLADTDNDGLSDGVEVSEQTNPNDGQNFCFACTVTVSNIDAVYTNGCCSYLFGQEISAPVTSFVGSATVELPHVTVTDGVVPCVVAWIDVNANGTWEVGEPRVIQTLTITNHGLSVSIDLLQANGDMDGDKMPDVWEVLHGFCPTNNADAFEDPDDDTLPNLFEYRYSTNPRNPLDGSNTVYSILVRSIDDRIRAKVNVMEDVRHIYLDYTNTVLTGGDIVPNTNAWTHGLDFSSMGIMRVRSGNTEYGLHPILISDRHVIEATHCWPAINDVVWFRASSGTMYERTIVGLKHCRTYANDVSIGILNSPLPQEIVPVKFLPDNYRQFIWEGEHLPMLRINKYSQAVVQEIARIVPFEVPVGDRTAPHVQYRISLDPCREAFRTDVFSGDSGHANFLVANGELIFLFPTHVRANGWLFGTSCLSILLKDEIETMMNDLCEEQGVAGCYSIQQLDFSSLIAN